MPKKPLHQAFLPFTGGVEKFFDFAPCPTGSQALQKRRPDATMATEFETLITKGRLSPYNNRNIHLLSLQYLYL
jgi:hypothetical protein